jgi:hypothetical protein
MQPIEKNPPLTIRDAGPMDRPQLRRAIIELQEFERSLHDTRLPGEQIADVYLAWIEDQVGKRGEVRVSRAEDSNSTAICHRRPVEHSWDYTHSHLLVGGEYIGTCELRAGGFSAI